MTEFMLVTSPRDNHNTRRKISRCPLIGKDLPDPPIRPAKTVRLVKRQMPEEMNILVAAVPNVERGTVRSHGALEGLPGRRVRCRGFGLGNPCWSGFRDSSFLDGRGQFKGTRLASVVA